MDSRFDQNLKRKLEFEAELLVQEKLAELEIEDKSSMLAISEELPQEKIFTALKKNLSFKPDKSEFIEMKKFLENMYFLKLTEALQKEEKNK